MTHVERTGREKQLIDAALIDAPPQQQSNNTGGLSNRKGGFGKDLLAGEQFNDEQKEQLGKLREEAVNAGKK